MSKTTISIRHPADSEIEAMGVRSWSIWTKEPSTFDWHYDQQETCYILEGEVTVKSSVEEVTLGVGDLVTFPRGLSCVWTIDKSVRKHYRFE